MSVASLLGVLIGFGLFFLSVVMSTNQYGLFLDIPSILMVVGGTVAVGFMSYQHKDVIVAFKAIGWMLKKPRSTREGLNTEIFRLIKWAYLVQAKGMPALEDEVKKIHLNDPLLQYCVELVTSNYPPADLRKMLETAVLSEFERATTPVEVLKQMASAGPAFGMIGTLVGMVVMLQGAGDDMAAMGKGLAIALLTTLYGVLIARLVYLPAALKLQQKEEIHLFRNELIVEGLVMLAEKQSPRYMEDRLNSFLETSNHFSIDAQLRGKK